MPIVATVAQLHFKEKGSSKVFLTSVKHILWWPAGLQQIVELDQICDELKLLLMAKPLKKVKPNMRAACFESDW